MMFFNASEKSNRFYGRKRGYTNSLRKKKDFEEIHLEMTLLEINT